MTDNKYMLNKCNELLTKTQKRIKWQNIIKIKTWSKENKNINKNQNQKKTQSVKSEQHIWCWASLSPEENVRDTTSHSILSFLNIHVFIWLRWVLVAVRGIFDLRCGMQDI